MVRRTILVVAIVLSVLASVAALPSPEATAAAVVNREAPSLDEASNPPRNTSSTVPPEPPAFTATPSSDLVDGKVITLKGAGSVADETLTILQCGPNPKSVSDCEIAQESQPDALYNPKKAWTRKLRVQRVIDPPSGTVDCAKAKCVAHVVSLNNQELAGEAVALGFANSGTVADRPQLSVAPRRSLGYAPKVKVKLAGFEPFTTVSIQQCFTDDLLLGYCGPARQTARAETDGSANVEMRLNQELYDASCLDVPCVLVATQVGRDPKPARLFFDPKAKPPALSTPVINISPNQDLSDGAIVEINVEYINDVSFWLEQCVASDTSACTRIDDVVYTPVAHAAACAGCHGMETNVPFEIRLRRLLHLDRGDDDPAIDCAAQDCMLRVQLNDRDAPEGLSEPLDFDSSVEPLTARATMAKRNKLVEGRPYKIKVSGYLGQSVEVEQCVRGAKEYDDSSCKRLQGHYRNSDISDDPFTFNVRPRRMIGPDSDPIDCFESNRCRLEVRGDRRGLELSANLNINFDPDAKSELLTMRVRPNRKLIDGQTVTVIVKNATDDEITLSQCPVADGGCRQVAKGEPTPTKHGVKYEITVGRFLGSNYVRDCARKQTGCQLRLHVDRPGELVPRVSVEVRFKRLPPPDTTLKVTPKSGLAGEQTVEAIVDAAGNLSGGFFAQCTTSKKSQRRCAPRIPMADRYAPPKGTDDFQYRTPVPLSRFVDDVDCATSRGRCVIKFWAHGDHLLHTVKLHFADTPLPKARPVAAEPNTDLTDRQLVTASSSGSKYTDIMQCVKIRNEVSASSCIEIGKILPSIATVREVTVNVRRQVVPEGTTTGVDCATTKNRCVLAIGRYGRGEASIIESSTELRFDPEAEPLVRTLVASPSEDLVDGQLITLTGTNWDPEREVRFSQCAGEEGDFEARKISRCDILVYESVIADDQGSFVATMAVRDIINGLSCYEYMCVFVGGDLQFTQAALSNDLSFAPK